MTNKNNIKHEIFENINTGMLFTVLQYTSLQVKLKEQVLGSDVFWENMDDFILKYKKIN